MVQTVLTGELTTGRRLTQLPVTKAPWVVQLNKAGTITATLKLDDPRVRERPELLLAVEPARSFLAVLAGETVLEAGPIWSHVYDDDNKTLTVRAAGLRSIFDHRIVMRVLAAGQDPATTSVTYSGALADIARDLVRLAVAHTGGALPIVIGDDIGGTDTRMYPGHELARVEERLAQLTGVIGGPDIAFEPRLTADRQGLEWLMRTGTTADPLLHQPGSSSSSGDGDWIWDRRAPRSRISSLSVSRDANGLAYRAWASGQGTGESLLIGMQESMQQVAHGYPLLESVSSHQSVQDPATLDLHATSDLISHMRPWTTWSLAVRGDRNPKLGSYRPGDWSKVWVPTDHLYLSQYLAAGFYRTRITGFSGDLGPTVKVDMAPTMDVR
jgi:hypothetical protein